MTFLTTRTSTGSKVDVFHQSQPLTQSSDVTHAVRVVKNVTCLSSLLVLIVSSFLTEFTGDVNFLIKTQATRRQVLLVRFVSNN